MATRHHFYYFIHLPYAESELTRKNSYAENNKGKAEIKTSIYTDTTEYENRQRIEEEQKEN